MSDGDLNDALNLAVSVLAVSREVLRTGRVNGVSVLDASGRDLKISTDVESEGRILEVLGNGSPYPVLAEESAAAAIDKGGRQWVVDPLDGSVNFYRGIPLYCVAVSLVEDGVPILGAILDAERDRVYTGLPGVGAWVGTVDQSRESPMSVRGVDQPREAILATGLPVAHSFDAGALMGFIPWFQQFKKVRMFGTAALSLLFVASGRVDAYAEDGIKIWDVAAGVALVRAAGGHVRIIPSGGGGPHSVDVRAAGSAFLWDRVAERTVDTSGLETPR